MNKKTLLGGGLILTFGITLSVITFKGNNLFLSSIADSQKYSITLDNKNSYSSGTSKTVRTDSGLYSLPFEYTGCSELSGYHASMSYGATIKNTEQITSIEKLEASYDGALSFRYSYDGLAWTEYFNMEDQTPYSLMSHPYYFEIKSVSNTKLSSLKITYTCVSNGVEINNDTTGDYEKVTSEPNSWEGQYLIVYEASSYCFDGSKTTLDSTSNYQKITISDDKIASTSAIDSYAFTVEKKLTGSYPYVIKTSKGVSIGTTNYTNSLVVSTTAEYGNALSYEDGKTCCYSEDECLLQFNNNSGQKRFRYFKSANQKAVQFYKKVVSNTPIPKDLLKLGLNKLTGEVAPGKTLTLTPQYTPSDVANEQKGVTWTSSNTSIAMVSSSGQITVDSNAPIDSTVTITATSTYNPALTASCVITVKEIPQDEWTIMLYCCGADLESGTSYADYLDPNDEYYDYYYDYYTNGAGACSDDISEILAVKNQPKNINILVQTGGATKWRQKDYNLNISKDNIQRWHVENQKLVLDETLDQANMGDPTTLQSYIEWGVENYPAEKIGLILWNHGGGMRGVCYDENYDDDRLMNSEIQTALSGAFEHLNRTEKFEFIGYDACLMAVQDIAETNSHYFNYMIASEESESGTGWDYDQWVDNLYRGDTTEEVLTEIVDTFIAENAKELGNQNDQTLSVMNLAYANEYMNAWETMTTQLSSKVELAGKSGFRTLIKTAKRYAVDSDNSQDYFGTFDAMDFLDKLSANSTYNPGSNYIKDVQDAYANMLVYNKKGSAAGNSNGLCCYYSVNSKYSGVSGSYLCYNSEETNFSNWLQFNLSYGY